MLAETYYFCLKKTDRDRRGSKCAYGQNSREIKLQEIENKNVKKDLKLSWVILAQSI